MPEDRRIAIENLIRTHGEIKLSQLEQIFNDVSSMTLRRDLEYLENKKIVLRVKGGAVLAERAAGQKEEVYAKRLVVNRDSKMLIASKAVQLLLQGQSAYFDAGTTVMELARCVPDIALSALTCSPAVALELAKNSKVTVTMLAGTLNNETLAVSGYKAISFLETVNIDIAFMGASGFTEDAGFTNGDMAECELKQAVIRRAKKVVMLMDSTKAGKSMFFTFARPENVSVAVTDGQFPEALAEALVRHDVEVM